MRGLSVSCAQSTTKRELSVRVPPQLCTFAFGNGDQCFQHGTHGLVAMTSAQHAEGRQLDPGWVYAVCRVCEEAFIGCRLSLSVLFLSAHTRNHRSDVCCVGLRRCFPVRVYEESQYLRCPVVGRCPVPMFGHRSPVVVVVNVFFLLSPSLALYRFQLLLRYASVRRTHCNCVTLGLLCTHAHVQKTE